MQGYGYKLTRETHDSEEEEERKYEEGSSKTRSLGGSARVVFG